MAFPWPMEQYISLRLPFLVDRFYSWMFAAFRTMLSPLKDPKMASNDVD